MSIQKTPNLMLMQATIEDYPIIQHMWPFYIYDMGRDCGLNKGWDCPANLSFVSDDLTHYFTDPTRQAFLIKIGEELAGFILLNKLGTQPHIDWNMSEFFILAKFQGKGIGRLVAYEIWKTHPGIWEVSVIPENKSALVFWRKVVLAFTTGNYLEEIKEIDYDNHQPKRYVLSFDTRNIF